MSSPTLGLRLNAVIVCVVDDTAKVLAVDGELPALPYGPLDPAGDNTLELGLRRWVTEQTGLELGYVEQLYTFGDRERDPAERLISIAYLALVGAVPAPPGTAWIDAYDLLPAEDWREERPQVIDDVIVPELERWADSAERRERADITYGLGGSPWDAARVLERYELLYEVGLTHERARDKGLEPPATTVGKAMEVDHRRMVATALGRLRGKLTYRPVVFELLPETFTLSELQRVVEALSGARLHKPNFRRLVEKGGLVEGTGEVSRTGGRPAELFRFRREVVRERPRPGVGLPGAR